MRALNGAQGLINDSHYRLIRNPLNKTITDFRETTKKLVTINELTVRGWHVSNPTTPKLYGLLKVHKQGPLKMRPIVSNIGAVTEKLSKWLVKTFKEIGPIGGMSVANSQEFIEKIRNIKLKRTESLVSFDVVSLFPSVPINDAIQFLEDWLLEQGVGARRTKDLVELTRLCMRHNDFSFRDGFHTMLNGTAMGNSLSPFLAEIFLAKLEKELAKDKKFPRLWIRYVDDVFSIVPTRKANETLRWLNGSRFQTISFTMETEIDRDLPFLDVMVSRDDDEVLSVRPYRKPTATQRTILRTSDHV